MGYKELIAGLTFLIFSCVPFVYGEVEGLKQSESEILLGRITVTKSEKKKAPLYLELAETYKKENKIEKAVAACEDALNLNSAKKIKRDVYKLLGDMYLARNDYFSAIEAFQEAINYAPKHLGIRISLAEAFEKNDLKELAIQEYLKVLQIDGRSFEANSRLGNIYMEKGFYKKAIKYYKDALRRKIDETIYSNLGVCYESTGEITLAISMLKNSIAVSPTYDGYTHIAQLYYSRKRLMETREYIKKAIDLDPDRVDAYVYSGLLYLQLGDNDTAKKQFLLITEKFKESAISHFFLAQLYHRENRKTAAIEELRKALEKTEPGALKEYSQLFLDYLNGKTK